MYFVSYVTFLESQRVRVQVDSKVGSQAPKNTKTIIKSDIPKNQLYIEHSREQNANISLSDFESNLLVLHLINLKEKAFHKCKQSLTRGDAGWRSKKIRIEAKLPEILS